MTDKLPKHSKLLTIRILPLETSIQSGTGALLLRRPIRVETNRNDSNFSEAH